MRVVFLIQAEDDSFGSVLRLRERVGLYQETVCQPKLTRNGECGQKELWIFFDEFRIAENAIIAFTFAFQFLNCVSRKKAKKQ